MGFLANPIWWLIFFVGFIGYFIYSFGQRTQGALFTPQKKQILQVVGGLIYLITLIAFFILFDLMTGIFSILISFVLVSIVTGTLLGVIFKR